MTAFSFRQRRRQCDAAMKGADEGRRRPWVLTRRGPGAWVMWLAGSPAAVLRRLRLGWRAYSLRGKLHAAMRVLHRGNEHLRVFARLDEAALAVLRAENKLAEAHRLGTYPEGRATRRREEV